MTSCTIAPPWTGDHLLALDGMSAEAITSLLDAAEAFLPIVRGEAPASDRLGGRVVGNLFLEDSTRTRCSFAMATARLGGQSIDLVGSTSSASKGETLLDTAANVASMGADALVIRCRASGGPAQVAPSMPCPVINAGDGKHEHPTQGLLDLLALRRAIGDLAGKRVAIVGDVGGSRVARSNIHGLSTLGAQVLLVGPPDMVPGTMTEIVRGDGAGSVAICRDLDSILGEVDAIMMLRVQFERGSKATSDYGELYGLSVERARRLRDGVPVLHPGPMNRGLEIDSAVADGQASQILSQVTIGVAVRMAVLASLVPKR